MAGEIRTAEVVVAADIKAIDKEKSSFTGYALSPAARLFHSPKFNCYIVAIMGCKTKINPAVVKLGLERTLIKHPRFSSKPVVDGCKGRKMKWEQTEVNLDDHIIIPNLDDGDVVESPDKFVEDYVSHLTTLPLDLNKPLWELHLLNVKTSDAEAVGVFKIHHSIGDGASLVSLLLACTRKSSDTEELPTVPMNNKPSPGAAALSGGVFLLIWTLLKLIWNTLVDLFLFAATMLFLKDTKTPIKALTVEGQQLRRFVHRTVSLDDIKLVKNALNMTINDVVVGVTQAGLSKYLYRRYGELCPIDKVSVFLPMIAEANRFP
ncbi:unnamed protein product [Linum tenue]|uniref:O-acyltransferase WSD1-like N-terminal domain-containing protein n=1 Tax=Linum tenue TaxID=586396 RepID=A0AAV0QBP8_9ROSI|nr:unnamed protein product [Linum tenue]